MLILDFPISIHASLFNFSHPQTHLTALFSLLCVKEGQTTIVFGMHFFFLLNFPIFVLFQRLLLILPPFALPIAPKPYLRDCVCVREKQTAIISIKQIWFPCFSSYSSSTSLLCVLSPRLVIIFPPFTLQSLQKPQPIFLLCYSIMLCLTTLLKNPFSYYFSFSYPIFPLLLVDQVSGPISLCQLFLAF